MSVSIYIYIYIYIIITSVLDETIKKIHEKFARDDI